MDHMGFPDLSGNACAAVRLDAKRLLIIGGSDDSSELDSTELLDLERTVFFNGGKDGVHEINIDDYR